MKSVAIRQLDNGKLMMTIQGKGNKKTFICDWIRDTKTSLELVRWSKEPDGTIRRDIGGNNIRTTIKSILKEDITDIKGSEFITKL